ncbi:muscarinic acetylcholine receptor M2-like [Mya arenaria]|uniref:muscarinic acetylcholine receptor M2-like n=1 Tax=Mya arenaria TaxID=6604 RepID=UPI0022E0F2E4|nr:muscarinic acetylcholine receptor M2-like [Mya arenaria]
MAVLPVTIFIGMEALIGFVGNILILIIYVRRREKSNFRYFIITMACIDFTSCITALPLEAFSQLHWYTYQYPSICKLKSFCNVFTAWASASILFLLAFDRHRKIRRPLQWQIQPSFAIRLCIASIFISAIVAIPVAILWGKQTYEYDLNGTKINVSVCEKDQAYADDIYPLLYIGTIYICPVSIMMGIVCILNFITSKTVFCATSEMTMSGKGLSNISPKSSNQSLSATGTLSTGISMNNHAFKQSNFDINCESQRPVKDDETLSSPRLNELKEDCTSINVSYITMRELDRNSPMLVVSQAQIDIGFDLTTTNESSTGSRKKLQHTCSQMSQSSRVSDNSKFSNVGSRIRDSRPKQKMVIMLVLTLTFVVTMMLYVILTSLVAKKESILNQLRNSEKAVFFLFWRLYFINTVVNPILYGIMDPRFRSGLKTLFKRNTLP